MTYKILIYLNGVSNGGGTHFEMPDGSNLLVENRCNRCVVFPIGTTHAGQPFPYNTTKITIGFRATFCNPVG